MKLESIYRKTKSGLTVEFRSASPDEAQMEIDYLKRVCGETPFLLTEAEDVSYTVEDEQEYIKRYEASDRALLLNAYVDGSFIGNGSFEAVNDAKRQCHRAVMGIAVFLDYCNLGVGEQLIAVLLEQARGCGYEIMELETYAHNARAIHLYEKTGFVKCGCLRSAVKYKDGSYDDEFIMQKFLIERNTDS